MVCQQGTDPPPKVGRMCTNFLNVLPCSGQLPPIVQHEMLRPQGGSHERNHFAVEVEDGPRALVGEREHIIKSNAAFESHRHAGVLPNDRDNMSEIMLRFPSM